MLLANGAFPQIALLEPLIVPAFSTEGARKYWIHHRRRSPRDVSPVPLDDAYAAMFVAFWRILGEVHGAGVLHRDISPEHCGISDDGELCLLDFSHAKITGLFVETTRQGCFPPRWLPLISITHTGKFTFSSIDRHSASESNPFHYRAIEDQRGLFLVGLAAALSLTKLNTRIRSELVPHWQYFKAGTSRTRTACWAELTALPLLKAALGPAFAALGGSVPDT